MSTGEQERTNQEGFTDEEQQSWSLPGPPLVPVGPVGETEPQPEEPVADEEAKSEENA